MVANARCLSKDSASRGWNAPQPPRPQQPILAPPSPQPPGCYSQPSGCYSQFDSQFPLSPPKARAPMPDRKVHHCMIVFLCIFAAVPRQAGLLRSLQFHIAGHVFIRLCDPFRRIRFSRDPFRRIRAVKHPPRSHRIEMFSPSCRESASASHKSLRSLLKTVLFMRPSSHPPPFTWRCGKRWAWRCGKKG